MHTYILTGTHTYMYVCMYVAIYSNVVTLHILFTEAIFLDIRANNQYVIYLPKLFLFTFPFKIIL